MSSETDNRIAWRIIDFSKDVLMHHRNFTPFQKLVFLTFSVGVLLGIFRNLWIVGIAVTYGVCIYISVTTAGFVLARHTYFASDGLLAFYNHAETVYTKFIHQQNVNILGSQCQEVQKQEIDEPEEPAQEDKFYDAPDQTPSHARKMSSTPRKRSDSMRSETSSVTEEMETILQYIHRDFIQSWYKLFSSDEEGLMEAEVLLHNISYDIKLRAQKQDRFELAQILMQVFSNHIRSVRQAQMMLKVQKRRRRSSVKPNTGSDSAVPGPLKASSIVYKTVEDCFAAKTELHPALRNKEMEQMYQKSVVEVILLNVMEDNVTETKSIVCALKEILMCNILQSVISLISDSTFLHERVIKITSNETLFQCKEGLPAVQIEETVISDKTVKSSLNTQVNLSTSDISEAVSSHAVSNELCLNMAKTESVKIKVSKTDDGLPSYMPRGDDGLPPDLSEVEKKKSDSKWVEDTKVYNVSKSFCYECNRLCSKDKDRISPRPHSCSLGTTPVFFDADRLSIDSFESFDSIPHDVNPLCDYEKCNSAPVTPATEHIPDIKINNTTEQDSVFEEKVLSKEKQQSNDIHHSVPAIEPAANENRNVSDMFFSLLPNPLNALPMLRKKSTSGLGGRNRSSPSLENSDEKSESVEIRKSVSTEEIPRDQGSPSTPVDITLWSANGPSVFQDVRLTGTETAKEPNGSSYTLYVIEYEALYQSDEDLVHRTGFVKRRFREFINLQSRLEDNSSYKDSLRDIKGPKKLIPSLPFGNMGKDTLENRKKLLEAFLQALIKRQDICNGEVLKQFMGYSGDGHIAFVRKNPEAASRIDQRLVKTMSGVFDKIVEGLPSLPPQLPRIMSSSAMREDREDDGKPLIDTDHLELDFSTEQDQQTFQKLDSALDGFMQKTLFDLVMEEEKSGDTTLGLSVLEWQEKQAGSPRSTGQINHRNEASAYSVESEHQTAAQTPTRQDVQCLDNSECPLTSAILDLLTELLSGQDSWLCRDNVTHLTKVTVGKGLNRYLESKVELLTSENMNIFYLQTLRETLWPDNQLSIEPRPQYTDGQKEMLKKQAARCLAEFLPGTLHTLLGGEDFNHLVEEVFETIKYEKLNRHFWYTIIDILLEKLFPEVSSVELQRKLSVTPEHS